MTARVTGSRRDVCVGDLGGVVARTRAPVWATSPLPPLTLSVRSRGRRVGPACRPPARTEELWRTCIGSVADLLLACLPRCCLESRGRAARMLREGFFVSFFFFLSFFNCIFLLPCSPFLFYGSVTTKAGRTKQVTFPGIAAAAAVFSAKISKRVKKKKKNYTYCYEYVYMQRHCHGLSLVHIYIYTHTHTHTCRHRTSIARAVSRVFSRVVGTGTLRCLVRGRLTALSVTTAILLR